MLLPFPLPKQLDSVVPNKIWQTYLKYNLHYSANYHESDNHGIYLELLYQQSCEHNFPIASNSYRLANSQEPFLIRPIFCIHLLYSLLHQKSLGKSPTLSNPKWLSESILLDHS